MILRAFVMLLVLFYGIPCLLSLTLTLLEGSRNRWLVKELYPFISRKRPSYVLLTAEALMYRAYMPVWNLFVVLDYYKREPKSKAK